MKKIRAVVFAAGFLLSGSSGLFGHGQNSSSDSGAVLQEAVRLRDEGEYLEAERLLAEGLGRDPANAALYVEIANVYAARYDGYRGRKLHSKARELLEKTVEALEKAVMFDPGNVAARFNLGVAYKRLGRFEKAREKFREVGERTGDPQTKVRSLIEIGSTYEEQGFFDEAVDCYRMAKEIDYGNPSIQSAIDDAGIMREEASRLQNTENAGPSIFSGASRLFPYSPNSQVRAWQEEGESSSAQGGLQSALPYLGSMLYEQFMKIRSRDE